MQHSIRTEVRDAVLAGVSENLDGDAVEAVEWASIEDTVLAVRNRHPLPYFDEYLGYGAAEVTL